MKPLLPLSSVLLVLGACGGGTAAGPPPSTPAAPVLPATVDVSIAASSPPSAVVGGRAVPMDGLAEGLVWPALRAAVSRKPGDHAPLWIAVPRDTSFNTVLRAVWTLRDADLRIVTPDVAGGARVLVLRSKPDAPAAGCHLAVFVSPAGDLRLAFPGGPRTIAGADAAGALARALAVERARCDIRYVAFGAERSDATWGAVFDVADTVDRDRSAGEARYVLAEPIDATP